MEFLVHITIDPPADIPDQTLVTLKASEAERAAQLSVDGNLVRLWRASGRWANWGLWQAADEGELTSLLETLPLHRFMQIEIHQLAQHPSDPIRRTEHDEESQ